MASHDQQHRHLPDDLLVDILTRLPVESLLRFKCVCKKWYALIRNPSFASAHLRIQKIQNKGRLFLHYFDEETHRGRYRHALFPDETLASDAYRDLDSPEQILRLLVWGGPLNGLFCLFDDHGGDNNDRCIIWNPATREFRTLPFADHSYCLTPHVDWVFSTIGFGTDNSTGHYKVVHICVYNHVDDVCVHVYSRSTNTWRHIDSLDYLLPEYLRQCSLDGAHSDGVYYWWAGSAVLAFDMGSEVFRVISAPCILRPGVGFHLCGYNDDRIALCQLKPVPETEFDTCEIWVMETEGSWIKLSSVGRMIPRTYFKLWFWKNGELLCFRHIQEFEGHYIFQLALYNQFRQELRYLGPMANWFCFQAHVYHESLVSVN